MASETNHPLQVAAELGNITPCGRGEECKLWGMGILRIVEGAKDYEAATTLIAAGCEVCPNPSGNLRLPLQLDSHGGERDVRGVIPVDAEVHVAHIVMTRRMNRIRKTTWS